MSTNMVSREYRHERIERDQFAYDKAVMRKDSLKAAPDPKKDESRYVWFYFAAVNVVMANILLLGFFPAYALVIIPLGWFIIPAAIIASFYLDMNPKFRPKLRKPFITMTERKLARLEGYYRKSLYEEVARYGYDVSKAVPLNSLEESMHQVFMEKDGETVMVEIASEDKQMRIIEDGETKTILPVGVVYK